MIIANAAEQTVLPWLCHTPDDLGLLPTFLSLDDPRSAREQFDEKYVSGWSPFKGHTFDEKTGELRYPGDPPLRPVGGCRFRDERIFVYPYAWVLVLQKDGSFEVCRMD